MLTLAILVLVSRVAAASDLIKVGMLTFAVFSQPAPKSVEQHYYKVGEHFSFLPGSIADYFGISGAMPVMIAFDMDREKIDWILKRIDGAVFTSGKTPLQGAYHDTLKYVVNWAKNRNSKGFYFPILAVGNGAEQLLQAESELANSHESLLDCSKISPSHMKSAQITKEMEQSSFWGKEPLRELMIKKFSEINMFYPTECVIPSSKITGSQYLSQNYRIIAEDKSSNVVIFESKHHPFFGAHFHPEKTLFERGEVYHFIDRSEHATELSRAIVKRLVDLVTQNGSPKPYKKISNQVKQYFGIFRPSEYPATSEYERIYTFQRFHDGF